MWQKLKTLLSREGCLHQEWTPWHIVDRVLYTPMFGRTVDSIQQQECVKCTLIRQREIPFQRYKKNDS